MMGKVWWLSGLMVIGTSMAACGAGTRGMPAVSSHPAAVKPSDVGGSRHEVSLRDVVRKNKGQVQFCYEQRLKTNPTLSGRLEIELNILEGRVVSAQVVQNTTGDTAIESCVINAASKWQFPTEVTAIIRLPFALSTE